MNFAVAVRSSPLCSPPNNIASILFKSSGSCNSSPRIQSLNKFHDLPSTSQQSVLSSMLWFHEKEIGEASTAALKRKRPARIDIPAVSASFILESPGKGERVEVVEVEKDGYSVFCKRGRKGRSMEDRYSVCVADAHGDSRQAFFGVFDGHGGAEAAELAAKKLGKNITEQSKNRRNVDLDKEMKEAIKDGYLKTDAECLEESVSGGTCCVTALIQEGNLAVSNAGDCRAVLCRRGNAEALTSDHRPSRDDERMRITSMGGYVDNCNGVWRIQGTLAVSRGIGDHQLKQWVISEPETKLIRLNPDCEFLILASDGLWDKVSNQEAIDMVRPLYLSSDKSKLLSSCKKLVNLSITRGSMDDISVMIVKLGCFL